MVHVVFPVTWRAAYAAATAAVAIGIFTIDKFIPVIVLAVGAVFDGNSTGNRVRDGRTD
jgi:hypothetical protein